MACDWSGWSINISEGQKKLSCQLTPYLITTVKETVTEGSRFPGNYQDPEGEGGRKIVDTEEIDNKVEFHQKSILRSC